MLALAALPTLVSPRAAVAWGEAFSVGGFRLPEVSRTLPDPEPTRLLQDRHGFVWIGTENGLVRFDGLGHELFHHRSDDPRSLASDRILALFESRSGELWVGTAAGACRFEAADLTFDCYLDEPESDAEADSPMPEDRGVLAIAEGRQGEIWLATSSGLYRLDPGRGDPRLELSTSDRDAGWPGGRILSLATEEGRVWLGTEQGLVAREADGSLRHYEHTPRRRTSLAGTRVRALRFDAEGRLWMATEAGLSSLVDAETGHFEHLDAPGAVDFAFDGESLWIALGRDGLVHQSGGGSVRRYPVSAWRVPLSVAGPARGSGPGRPDPGRGVRALYVDAEGRLWAVIAGVGVVVRDSTASAYGWIGPEAEREFGPAKEGRTSSAVGALLPSSGGELWIGRPGRVERLGPSGLVGTHPLPSMDDPPGGTTAIEIGDEVGAEAEEVTALLEEALPGEVGGSRLWVATRSRGLWWLDPASGAYQAVPGAGPEIGSVVALGKAVSEPGRGPEHWLATRDGVFRLSVEEAMATRIPISDEVKRSADPRITDLWVDAEGGVWVTTLGGPGLLHLAPGGDDLVGLRPVDRGDDQSRMRALLPSPDGELWIATDGGLISYLPDREEFRISPLYAPLADRRLSDLAFDGDGNLWLVSADDLYRVSLAETVPESSEPGEAVLEQPPVVPRKVVSLGPAPLGDPIAWTDAHLVALDDRIFLGTDRGLLEVDPEGLEPPAPRRPMLVGLRLDGKPMEPRSRDAQSPLLEAMTELDVLKLGPGVRTFSLEFAGLDYGDPGSLAFVYRLEGYDPGWRTTDASHPAVTYPSLPADRYVFELWSVSDVGKLSPAPFLLPIVVQPAWWASPLARLTYFVIAIALGLAVLSAARNRLARTRALGQRLQEAQSQKLESLSTLAGGIAHDFNNLLVGIFGHAELARMEVEDGSRMAMHLDQIEKAATRAADLSRQMLFYSGRGNFVVEPIDLSALVGSVAEDARSGLPTGVRLLVEIEPQLPPIEGDSGQLRQLLTSLINNAAESLEGGEGFIVLATGIMHCDKEFIGIDSAENTLPPGDYVFLTVDDTGKGIEPTDIPKIFDPFFSTKSPGRGLGLAATQGIVRGHGGAMQVSSTVSRGSTFRVLFPVISKAESIRGIEIRREGEGTDRSRGLVLVVDDEKTVRLVAAEYLEHLGFRVLQAVDGRQALEIFVREHGALTLVLLDLNMPGMDGVQTFREMRQLDADVPVVLSTGFTEEDAAQRLGRERPEGLIEKPYRLAQLRVCIREVLEGSPREG